MTPPGQNPAGGVSPGPRPRELDTSLESRLSNVRHSLRTPLNQIIGYCEMLQEELPEQGHESVGSELQKIHAAGAQLLTLINESLATSRVAAGKCNVADLMRDCRTLLHLIIGYAELCEEESGATETGQFLEDLRKIQKAARNLMGLLNDPAFLGPLEAADPSLARPSPPLGVDGGAPAPRPPTEAVPVGTPVLTGRLLLVDDSELNRDMLSRRLERLGHTVLLAENGRQALQRLRTQPVDLLLLDLLMPEMDGMETLERLRADEQLRHIPVIMLSALDEMDRVVRCIEMGADDYLQKPFNPVLLKARIGACLEKKRLRDQEQAYLEQIQTEREKSDRLLLNVLPGSVADRLKQGETTIADAFPDVTVLFADLVEFTRLASTVPAAELVRLLNEIFSQFDWLVELHRLEKIKTIGDAYMVVGGLPRPHPDHAAAVAEMALDMQNAIHRLEAPGGRKFSLRIGISTGPVIAGIIGSKKFIYDLWGDTVNIASRMESHGQIDSIHVSQATYERLRDRYVFEERGRIEVKGKGEMSTWFLLGRKTP